MVLIGIWYMILYYISKRDTYLHDTKAEWTPQRGRSTAWTLNAEDNDSSTHPVCLSHLHLHWCPQLWQRTREVLLCLGLLVPSLVAIASPFAPLLVSQRCQFRRCQGAHCFTPPPFLTPKHRYRNSSSSSENALDSKSNRHQTNAIQYPLQIHTDSEQHQQCNPRIHQQLHQYHIKLGKPGTNITADASHTMYPESSKISPFHCMTLEPKYTSFIDARVCVAGFDTKDYVSQFFYTTSTKTRS